MEHLASSPLPHRMDAPGRIAVFHFLYDFHSEPMLHSEYELRLAYLCVQSLVDGLRQKGHVIGYSSHRAVVQAVYNRCRYSSQFEKHHYYDDGDERCLVAVCDWRKHGSPSGF